MYVYIHVHTYMYIHIHIDIYPICVYELILYLFMHFTSAKIFEINGEIADTHHHMDTCHYTYYVIIIEYVWRCMHI